MSPNSEKLVQKTEEEQGNRPAKEEPGSGISLKEDVLRATANAEHMSQTLPKPDPEPGTMSTKDQFVESENTDLLGKEAPVWKTYVDDTNRSDKETANGRNRHVDLLPRTE
ncbi:hypothetical protein RhiJN_22391 [Ceratobasidium sp. AG-Ba]|nr:hypothetical protein RhiJN_22391 [Ceratobasidium sp. AG-Ba]